MKLKHILDVPSSIEIFEPKKHVHPIKHIPWLASPLAGEGYDHEEKHSTISSDHSTSVFPAHDGQVTTIQREFDGHHEGRREGPIFKRHHESTTIELFYDLFFVGNLATFTANHEINTKDSMASYIGFFTIMWFTWFQTSLFDVRFGTDSAFSRVCKACSFGVMTGFAIVGPLFDTNAIAEDTRGFRSMALILMASRLVLMLQYTTVYWYVRGYRKASIPLLVTIFMELVSGMAFLGTFFAFKPNQDSKAYIGWYVIIAVEAVVMIAVSAPHSSALTFKGTHLVERIGLLTLIIMGEGIIGITKSVTRIMQGSSHLDSSTIGTVICAVLIIYFIWMLYFDQIEADRFATVRQPIWALLHFGLHVAILLTVEGSTQFILWWVCLDNSYYFENLLNEAYSYSLNDNSTIDGTYYSYNLNVTLESIKSQFRGTYPLPDFSSNLQEINELPQTDAGLEKALEITQEVIVKVIGWIFKNFGLEAPKSSTPSSGANGETEEVSSIVSVFDTVYIYFFSGAGCFLVLLGVMYWFGKKHKTIGEMVSVFVRILIGMGLAFLALLYVPQTGYGTAYINFQGSPWVLPCVMLTFLVVIGIDNLVVYLWNRSVHRRMSVHDPNGAGVEQLRQENELNHSSILHERAQEQA